MIDERMFRRFRDIGRDLYVADLISLARRQHERALSATADHQTARGACSGRLKRERPDRDGAREARTAASLWPPPSWSSIAPST